MRNHDIAPGDMKKLYELAHKLSEMLGETRQMASQYTPCGDEEHLISGLCYSLSATIEKFDALIMPE